MAPVARPAYPGFSAPTLSGMVLPAALVERLAAGFEASSIAVSLTAPDDTIVYASPSYRALWDMQPGARTFADIMRHCYHAGTGPAFATNDIEQWLVTAQEKRRSAPQRSFEIDMRDGRWFWATETLFEDGWLWLAVVDITRLKANENVLRQDRDAALFWAETDMLTGLYNRRHAMKRLDEAVDTSGSHGLPLTIALIDIDHFKSINDGHGHDIGDQVLQHFAATGRMGVRIGDLLARVGGEEFLLIMPDATSCDGFNVADQMRGHVAQSWPVGEDVLRYTMSAGVAQLRAGETAHQLYHRADRALYRAKASGRNRVEPDDDHRR